MAPHLRSGDVVVVAKKLPRPGQVALAVHNNKEIIKRVETVERGKFYLVGDNSQHSTDSRHFGAVKKSAILGTIMIVLPTATNPPALTKPYGVWLGRLAALILIGMVLVHLFRIDTFIPLLDEALPSGSGFATFMALLVILSELFAIPFALRMRLSPLAHAVSGALVVFAPLWWVVISIMTVGLADNTGQLGEFVVVPSTLTVLGINVVWVLYSYFTLYSLGYDRIRPGQFLRK